MVTQQAGGRAGVPGDHPLTKPGQCPYSSNFGRCWVLRTFCVHRGRYLLSSSLARPGALK